MGRRGEGEGDGEGRGCVSLAISAQATAMMSDTDSEYDPFGFFRSEDEAEAAASSEGEPVGRDSKPWEWKAGRFCFAQRYRNCIEHAGAAAAAARDLLGRQPHCPQETLQA